MKLHRFFILIFVCLLASSIFADTYQLDPKHSRAQFSVKHLTISTVRGDFKDFDATIEFDPKDASKCSVTGTIKTASIDTGNENRDNDLRTNTEFFEAEKYPEIKFASSKVAKKGDSYLVTGNLTLHGVTKEITFPATISGPIQGMGGSRIGIEAELKINRRDYGITWDKHLDTGGAVVSDEVQISLTGEAAKK